MICNRCGTQNVVNANFCSACGTQLRQQLLNPFSNPGFQPHNLIAPDEGKAYRSIFTIGIIVFAIDIFWALYNFIVQLIGYEHFSDLSVFITPLSLISSVALPFTCFLFARKGSQKNVLLVLFIVISLIQLYRHYLYKIWEDHTLNF
jgi:hypothetical protein